MSNVLAVIVIATHERLRGGIQRKFVRRVFYSLLEQNRTEAINPRGLSDHSTLVTVSLLALQPDLQKSCKKVNVVNEHLLTCLKNLLVSMYRYIIMDIASERL
jgi:hypothetical protein